jgi:hypothetical protein
MQYTQGSQRAFSLSARTGSQVNMREKPTCAGARPAQAIPALLDVEQ